MKDELLFELENRGFLNQASNINGMASVLDGEKISLYYGSDPTGDSLHVGHIVPIMMMRWFKKFGHRPIMLVGGATARIGDPSGRNSGRPMMSDAEIEKNSAGLKKSYRKILGCDDFLMVDNYDWMKKFNHLEFLNEFGADFTVPRMLSMESVKKRLETGMTFLEFNYMTFQAVDFLELFKKHHCLLQICGADQWGNSIMGVELIRKKTGKEAFVLSTPLITDSNGNKIGKSAGNAVWINEEKTSPFDYYQYFRNVQDELVGKYLKLFTDLPLSEIAKLAALKDSEINEAKKILAFEATKIAHGDVAALGAMNAADALFCNKSDNANIETIVVNADSEMNMIDLAIAAGLFQSKSDARRTIEQGGLKINGNLVSSITEPIPSDKEILFQKGKKTFVKVKIGQ